MLGDGRPSPTTIQPALQDLKRRAELPLAGAAARALIDGRRRQLDESSGGRPNGSLRCRRRNGLAPVFSFEPGSRLISHDSTSALAIVSPTAITTGPTPELPDDDPAPAMICRPDIASRYR